MTLPGLIVVPRTTAPRRSATLRDATQRLLFEHAAVVAQFRSQNRTAGAKLTSPHGEVEKRVGRRIAQHLPGLLSLTLKKIKVSPVPQRQPELHD